MISKLDPNLVLSICVALIGWVWSKLHHQKTDSLTEVLKGIAIRVTAEVLADGTAFDLARDRVTAALYTGLERVGIRRSAIVELAVSAAVERALGEIAKQTLAAQMAKTAAAAQEVTGEFARAEARGKAAAAAVFGPVTP